MTSALPLPDLHELLSRSMWAATVPGLPGEASEWLATLPTERERLQRKARRLARPALHPEGLVRAAEIGGRVALAGLLWATSDTAVGTYRRLIFGEDLDVRRAAMARAESVVRAGGPTYVKLGQFIATARGILPDEVVDAFSWCRDEVPPLPAGEARAIIDRALADSPARARLVHIDDEPLGAASIAQVHGGRLDDGTDVVVKVRRPGLGRQFSGDIRALAIAAAIAENRSSAARAANLTGFVELFAELVLEELDFRLEALNMVEVGLAAEDARADFVRIPRPIPGLVTSRVLVMERVPGVRYTDVDSVLDADVDRQRLLQLGIQGILEHTLVYGRFHGDLHAGNVLIDRDGTFALVDFGILGRITAEQRDALVRLMVGVAMGDTRAQLEAAKAFGAVPEQADLDTLTAELEAIRPDRDGMAMSQAELADGIGRVVQLLVSNGFRLPKTLVLFLKNLLYLNGFAAAIAPDADILGVIDPIFEHFQRQYAAELALMAGIN